MNNQTNQDQADGKFDRNVTQAGATDADSQVRETEDASLQDDTYSFDEDNTSNEDIHDVSDFGDMDSDLLDSIDDSN